jgi:hypothetical protein
LHRSKATADDAEGSDGAEEEEEEEEDKEASGGSEEDEEEDAADDSETDAKPRAAKKAKTRCACARMHWFCST